MIFFYKCEKYFKFFHLKTKQELNLVSCFYKSNKFCFSHDSTKTSANHKMKKSSLLLGYGGIWSNIIKDKLDIILHIAG